MLIQDLRHVVNRTRIGRVEDRLFHLTLFRYGYLDIQVALRDLHSGGAVTVDSHGSQVNDVNIEAGFYNRG